MTCVVSSADKSSALLAFMAMMRRSDAAPLNLWTMPCPPGTSPERSGLPRECWVGREIAPMASSCIGIDSASDETLVRSVARREERAMRVLFARHQRRVFLFLTRILRDETLAEDVVSDVFLDVWRKAETFKAQSSVPTWLLAIARNKALTALGRRSEV